MRSLTYLFLLLATISQAQTNIAKAEYWIDIDPGFGNANTISGFNYQPDVSLSFGILANLSQGVHTLGFRSKNLNGEWSHTNLYPIYIADSSDGEIVKIEYFWDIDPGFGNGIDSILSVPAADITNGLFTDSVPLSFLLSSTHVLFERSMDGRGRWSHTNYVDSLTITGTVDVSELPTLSGINIYPNPFTDVITVDPLSSGRSRLIIYDNDGRKIIDQFIQEKAMINTQHLAKGFYTVFILTSEKQIFRSTVVKQ